MQAFLLNPLRLRGPPVGIVGPDAAEFPDLIQIYQGVVYSAFS